MDVEEIAARYPLRASAALVVLWLGTGILLRGPDDFGSRATWAQRSDVRPAMASSRRWGGSPAAALPGLGRAPRPRLGASHRPPIASNDG